MQELLNRTKRELESQGKSQKTIEAYLFCLKRYFEFKKGDLERLNVPNIKYFLFSLDRKGLSPQTVNLHLNAIRFFYKRVQKTRGVVNIAYAQKEIALPVILTRDEIGKLLASIKNGKHKLLLSLAYGAGLTLNEIISLKVKSLDLNELTLHVQDAHGNETRRTVIPEKIRDQLQNLIIGKSPDSFVFESERGGGLTARSAQKMFEKALEKSGIKKEASFHSLRHSFATHLLETGVDIKHIQTLLGHKNLRTTQRYLKLVNSEEKTIKSPL